MLVAVMACAASLAACGGGDDSSDSTAATSPSATNAGGSDSTTATDLPATDESEGNAGATAEETEASGGESAQESESDEGSSGDRDLPQRGTVSSRSSSFQQYSGKGQTKLHLAEFGEEASDGHLGAVQSVIEGYLQAIGAGEWEKACTYLTGPSRSEIDQAGQESEQTKPSKCGKTLEALVTGFNEQTGTSFIYATEGVASLRMKQGGLAGEGAGFALFHGSDGEDHWMAVKREGGEWRVLSTAPQPFL